MFARQLSLKHSVQDVRKNALVIEAHVVGNGDAMAGVPHVVRKHYPRWLVNKIVHSIPEEITRHVSGVTLSEILALPPHVHTREKCVINFYLKTSGEITTFYCGDIVVDDTQTVDSGKGYYLVAKNKLTYAYSFIATDGSTWLLNTKQPHSVSGSNESDARVVIQVFLDIPYEEALSILEKKLFI